MCDLYGAFLVNIFVSVKKSKISSPLLSVSVYTLLFVMFETFLTERHLNLQGNIHVHVIL